MRLLSKFMILLASMMLYAGSCDHPTIKKDMVQFDKAFVPVHYYVYGGNTENAQRAIFFLDHRWQQFSNKYKGAVPDDEEWAERFRRTEGWLTEAYASINNCDKANAYIYLDHVRYEMMDMRERYHIEHYLDHVWDLEFALDIAAEAAADPTLCELEWDEFEFLVQEVKERWEVLREAPKDIALYEFDDKELVQLGNSFDKLGRVLTRFSEEVECGERNDLTNTAIEAKRAYLDFLKNFGDFNASKSTYAANKR